MWLSVLSGFTSDLIWALREIEELMTERGVDVSYETIRRWVEQFGPVFAERIKTRSPNPSTVWYLDEVYTKINGKMVYLWRAVDDEGNVLDIVVQSRRNMWDESLYLSLPPFLYSV